MGIESSFGRLKARSGRLCQKIDIYLEDLLSSNHSCFILNDFCGLNNEHINSQTIKHQ